MSFLEILKGAAKTYVLPWIKDQAINGATSLATSLLEGKRGLKCLKLERIQQLEEKEQQLEQLEKQLQEIK